MSKSKRTTIDGKGRQRRISVRAVRRAQPDIARLGRAVVAMALQAEADAQAESARLASKQANSSTGSDEQEATP